MFTMDVVVGQRVRTYGLGLGGVFVVIAFPFLIYTMLGYAVDLANAVRAGVILAVIVPSIVFRVLIINNLYRISPAPIVQAVRKRVIVEVASFGLLVFSQRVIVSNALKALSATFQTNATILGGISLAEESACRFLVCFAVYIASLRLGLGRAASVVLAVLTSSGVFYGLHTYVLATDTSGYGLYIFVSGVNLGISYLLTGSISSAMGKHVAVDELALLYGGS